MTVHHFTPRELRDMADQITSRTIADPLPRRGPTVSAHGIGNHWLRFGVTDDLGIGRFCTFPGCTYTDRHAGRMPS